MTCPAVAIALAAAVASAGCGDVPEGAGIHTDPPARHHTLSFDGSKMIVLRDYRKGSRFDVIETASGKSQGLLSRAFVRASWGEDSDTAYAVDSGGKLYRVSFRTDAGGIEEIRLTGPGAIPAGGRPRVVSFPTSAAPFFLVRSSAGQRPLYRCDPGPGSGGGEVATTCRVLFEDGRRVALLILTPDGRVAARIVLSRSGERVFQARAASGEWEPKFRFTRYYDHWAPVGGVQPDNTVWALSNRGRDRIALVRLDVGTGEEEVFFEHDRFDLEKAAVFFDRAGRGTPLLATYNPGHQAIVHFDRRLEAAYGALRDKAGRPSRIDFGSIDLARKHAVVEVRNPRLHRTWYLLDLDGGPPRELSASDLEYYDRPPSPSRPVTFPARDGLMLHGYLTLPQRAEGAGPPPMILMLHGGPWSRYQWPAPSLVRFLGSRGYAVLRLNFRGSTGYGRKLLEAGTGAVFGSMQEDVLDAAGWAVAQGHAADGRIALYGGSFGGFLTLAMLGRHPRAFRAGIALNAITDAVDFWRTDWKRPAHRALWREFFGTRDLPTAALSRISPVNNADRIAAPVLLLAGARDRRVPALHSQDLFLLLKDLGRPVRLVEYRGAAHNIFNLASESRDHLVEAIVDFLGEHFPARGR